MRRLYLAFLPALLALALGACGESEEQKGGNGEGSATTAEGGTPPPPQTQPPEQPASGEEEEVRAAVAKYLEGLARDNAPQVCEALTEDAQRLLGRDLGIEADGCEDAAREAAEFAGGQGAQALRDAKALNVNIKGDTATVNVAIAGTEVPIQADRVDGEWRVSNANEQALIDALP